MTIRHSLFRRALVRQVFTGSLLLFAHGAVAETVAITGGAVHTLGKAGVLENATILIDSGKIKAVGVGIAIPADARVIDAKGHIVTPGLMNSYTDLGLDELTENAEETMDSVAPRADIGPGFDVYYGLNPNSVTIPVARIEGMTRAIAAPSAGTSIFAGTGAEIHLGNGSDILAKRKIGMFIELGEKGGEIAGGARSAAWAQLLSALDEARSYDRDRAGYKRGAHPPYTLKQVDLEAMMPVIHGEMPLVVSVQRESDIRHLIRFKQEQKINVIIVGGAEAWRVANELSAAQIPVILQPLLDLPNSFEALGTTLQNAVRLQKAGVRIAFSGTAALEAQPYNVGNIAMLAGIAAANGLSQEEALAAITVNPAQIWGISDHYGTIEPGKDADIVVWDGDPLEPSSAPTALFIRGDAISLESRQTKLRDRYMNLSSGGLPPGYRK